MNIYVEVSLRWRFLSDLGCDILGFIVLKVSLIGF